MPQSPPLPTVFLAAVFLRAEISFSVSPFYQKWEDTDQEGWVYVRKMGGDIFFVTVRPTQPVTGRESALLCPHDSYMLILPTVWRVDPQVDGHWGDAFVGPRDPVGLRFNLLSDFIKVCKLFGLAVQKFSIFCKGKKDIQNEKEKQSYSGWEADGLVKQVLCKQRK